MLTGLEKDDKRWPDAVIPFYERDPDLVDYREEQTNVHHGCVPPVVGSFAANEHCSPLTLRSFAAFFTWLRERYVPQVDVGYIFPYNVSSSDPYRGPHRLIQP